MCVFTYETSEIDTEELSAGGRAALASGSSTTGRSRACCPGRELLAERPPPSPTLRFLATTESCGEAVRGTSGPRKNSPNRPGGSCHLLAAITKLRFFTSVHSHSVCGGEEAHVFVRVHACAHVCGVRVHVCENV